MSNRKRQLTLFGTYSREKTKHFVIYKNPKGNHECHVERFCLRAREIEPHATKQNLLKQAQEAWKLISKDIPAQEKYIKLREAEKDFIR